MKTKISQIKIFKLNILFYFNLCIVMTLYKSFPLKIKKCHIIIIFVSSYSVYYYYVELC